MRVSPAGARLAAAALAAALAGPNCAGSSTGATNTPAELDSTSARPRSGGAFQAEGEVGAMDVDAVKETMAQAMPAFDECMDESRRRLPFAGGEVAVFIRVDGEGQVRLVYLTESDLGDHEAESCIRQVIRDRTWPKPEGGEEGVIEQRFALEADANVRAATEWSESDLGRGLARLRPRLASCRQNANTGPIDATLYVAPTGRTLAVGVAVSDEQGNDAIDCIVRTLEAGRFPTPGSYPAKVSLRID